MRILMLGWEFPPFISGGLGTACHGLTRALDRQGHKVYFLLPKPVEAPETTHVTLLSPSLLKRKGVPDPLGLERSAQAGSAAASKAIAEESNRSDLQKTEFFEVPANFSSPYPDGGLNLPEGVTYETVAGLMARAQKNDPGAIQALKELGIAPSGSLSDEVDQLGEGFGDYGRDLFADAHRYARIAAAIASGIEFDVVHAHDWLTYPAGVAIRRLTGKPLVCHIHATEFDRSGDNVNQPVYDIERMGMHACDRLIAVSMLTRSICMRRYGVPESKIDVVYNGVEQEHNQPEPGAQIGSDDKIVLFLGRITMQKGPEYFIRAAKRVLEKVENVKFVVAGSGDMAMRMIEQAAGLGIGSKVLFTGFLRGRDVARVFRMADCYVMPSVSEPFGIAPLEAMSHDTPVIISKQSGVAEVLQHALKVDFWDTDEMANKIVAVLKYPPLSKTLRQHGVFELKSLTWDRSAEKVARVYERAISSV
ncbi:MAG: glycosyltransferase [Phycisphaerales bacterium]|nr:MAG: glycosyltransferase [Phycisphaerales bacterium]